MRGRFVILLGAILCLAGAGTRAQQQFQILASFVDGTGAAVATVDPAALRISENGAEATVIKVEPFTSPAKVQLLLDNGIGLGSQNLIHLRNGVRDFINAMPDGVEVTMVTTAPQPRFIVRATTDKAALLKGVDLLAPDSGAGRFVESLNEATQRIERDKTNYTPIIVSVATTAGDTDVRESDINRMMQRLQARPTKIHVILMSAASGRTAGGATQTNVGIAITQGTGRFENINGATRIATLLPEIGADVAKSHVTESQRFRITVQRPSGATGDVTKVSVGARGGISPVSVALEGPVR